MEAEKLKKALDGLEEKKKNQKEFEKKMQEVIDLLEKQLKGYGKKWESRCISANAIVYKKEYERWKWYSKEIDKVYLYWNGERLSLAIKENKRILPSYKKLPWMEWECLYVEPESFFKAVNQLLDYLSGGTDNAKQLEKMEKIKQTLQED